eukprot:Unigene14401_Nuclearia_a/m.43444 Unigene14401_Nuclearia_a/g.43444  ORF Unigene14401_Nuclearia_a/g.43444 Unigene14401_Nuclearia_a/m.43444 type:complete len:209 (+) Unigene14401_Nuclearia_a:3-629(+)
MAKTPDPHDPPGARPDRALADGDVLRVDGAAVRVVATPGHTPDHLCLLLLDPASDAPTAVLTGDAVLGHGTAVFEDLGAYMASLERLRALLDALAEHGHELPLFPGHGDVVPHGRAKIAEYIEHRRARERQIVDFLANHVPPGGAATAAAIVAQLYKAYPAHLHGPAEANVLLHLHKLHHEGAVVLRDDAEADHAKRWALVAPIAPRQ